MEFEGNWEKHNTSFRTGIRMALCEVLDGWKCYSPTCWDESMRLYILEYYLQKRIGRFRKVWEVNSGVCGILWDLGTGKTWGYSCRNREAAQRVHVSILHRYFRNWKHVLELVSLVNWDMWVMACNACSRIYHRVVIVYWERNLPVGKENLV